MNACRLIHSAPMTMAENKRAEERESKLEPREIELRPGGMISLGGSPGDPGAALAVAGSPESSLGLCAITGQTNSIPDHLAEWTLELYPHGIGGVRDKSSDAVIRGKRDPVLRGKIQTFSDRSRIRLLRKIQQVSRLDSPLFVTLTYADWDDSDSRGWKVNLQRFLRGLRIRFLDACGFWRLEFQSRGAPHFHLALWFDDPPALPDFEAWASERWIETIGDRRFKTQKHACKVEFARSARNVMLYLAGHAVKKGQVREGLEAGRYWGILRPELLGIGEPVDSIVVGFAEAIEIRRRLAELVEENGGAKYAGVLRNDVERDFFAFADGWVVRRWIAEMRAGHPDDPF